ncbi:MAG: TonB-dependent receptor [Verrucomicrobia bacterium]|nr:TonB-dependent receptor [Verrucomicrobiota bacterium]
MNNITQESFGKVVKAVRYAAILGAVTALGVSPRAFAQQDASTTNAPTKLKPAVVTGSLIPTAATATATPVDVITTEAIEATGSQNLYQLVRTLPAAYGPGNYGDSRGNGGNGSAAIALRGLQRGTLVLINGRRVAPENHGIGSGNVDLNLIPLAAIDHVEILKDGASAIYGADAQVAVVNIILKKDFNGSEFSASYGNTTETDVGQQNYSFVTGGTTERSSYLIGGSYYKENALFSKDRARSRVDVSDINNTSGNSNPGRVMEGTFGSAGQGVVYGGPPGTYSLNPADFRDYNPSTDRFPFPNYTPAVQPVERYSFFGNGDYNIFAKNLVFFTEAMYTHSWFQNQLAPTPMAGQSFGIVVPASNPYNPFGQDIPTWRYRLLEAGPRTDTFIGDIFRIVNGLKGQVADTSWNWETAFSYSLDQRKEIQGGDVNVAALANQVSLTTPDAFNPFGNQANTHAQFDPLVQQNIILSDSANFGVDGKVNGDLFDLKSGTVRSAIGAAHFEENVSFTPDSTIKNNQSVGFNGALPYSYGRDDNSFFAEVKVPFLGEEFTVPGIHSFEVDVAGRYDHYSDFGGTWNPKVSFRWEPVDDSVVLRGSWGTSFRAPDFISLASTAQNFPEVFNPFTGIFEQPAAGVLYLPNPNLKPETAENWTAGVVWSPKTPNFLKGLTISVDYYRIDIQDWIGQSTQFIINENLRTGGPTNPASLFYTNVAASFDPTTGGYDNAPIIVPAFNLHRILTEGIDIAGDYKYPTDNYGTFDLRLAAEYVLTYDQQTSASSTPQDRLGNFSADEIGFESIPRLRGNASLFWDYKGFEFGVTANYTASMRDDKLAVPSGRNISSFLTWDLQASYTITGWKHDWVNNTKFTVGVLNVADSPPPRVEAAFADKYDRDLFDLRQRFVYCSLSKKF